MRFLKFTIIDLIRKNARSHHILMRAGGLDPLMRLIVLGIMLRFDQGVNALLILTEMLNLLPRAQDEAAPARAPHSWSRMRCMMAREPL